MQSSRPRRTSTARYRARRRRRASLAAAPVALALAIVLVVGLLAVDPDSDAQPVLPRDVIDVNVAGTPTGRPISPGFVGFSIEYHSLLDYTGSDAAAPNPTFIRLVRALAPYGAPVIRLGGDTTDWTWWPATAAPKPRGIRYELAPRLIAAARATALALGARLILGINLEADSPTVAGTEARVLLHGLGRRLVAGFELGNEPEVYGAIGWYTNSAGVSVLGRPSSYGFPSYLGDYAAISSALPRGVPLAGPASGAPKWIAGVSRFLAANPRVRLVTYHSYPLRRCYTSSSSPTHASVANLLSPAGVDGAARSFQAAVRVAHARGLQFRVDEVNSVSCKGTRGVSDVFASALWGLDELFHLARVGVDGVNIHTLANAPYEPFAFTHSGHRWRAQVKPLYYGLLLFARAAPAGSRLLATAHAPRPALRTWATAGPGAVTRVVLINDSPHRPLTVAVRLPASGRTATVEHLVASGLRAKGGIRLGGQTFGAATATGELSGASRAEALQPVQHRYVVHLQSASAALLTLTR